MAANKKTPRNLPPRGPGRPKGAQNKLTVAAKDAINEAAAKLGGTNRLAEWAKEDPLNERAFWATIYPKLLPLQIGGDPNNPVGVIFKTVYERSGN